MTRGMVLGKFMPPHLGHLYLVEFARHACDDLTVVVGTLPTEPIPGLLRYRWMQELAAPARVVHLDRMLPQDPSETPDFWDLWRTALLDCLPHRPDLVFASEEYGVRLAAELGAEFVPVDIGRSVIPVTATRVRRDPFGAWPWLPPPVRAWYAFRVCLIGPESTGKTTLAQDLAHRYDTVLVPEYARTLLERQHGEVRLQDMRRIARGQMASEDALARRANKLLICDTDVLTTSLWSRFLFDTCDPWIVEQAAARRYDLYLLTDTDVPFEPDRVRYRPDQRQAFLELCVEALRDRPHVRVQGDRKARLRAACDAIDRLFQRRDRTSLER